MAVFLFAAAAAGLAQTPSSPSPESGEISETLKRQRSAVIYAYKTSGESGWQRGEEIYYTKCWICHNQYTIKAGTGAVPLKDLYNRPMLISGQPISDQTVTEKIRTGGPGMPSYQYVLDDRDMADLLSYLRDGHCCFEGSEPPKNPAYKY